MSRTPLPSVVWGGLGVRCESMRIWGVKITTGKPKKLAIFAANEPAVAALRESAFFYLRERQLTQ